MSAYLIAATVVGGGSFLASSENLIFAALFLSIIEVPLVPSFLLTYAVLWWQDIEAPLGLVTAYALLCLWQKPLKDPI
jgi:hypothetical protein